MKRITYSHLDQTRAQLTISAVALEFGTPHLDLLGGNTHNPQLALARHVGMYLVKVVYETSLASIARAFNRHPSTIRYAVMQVEEERDDPVLDEKIRRLERFLREASQTLEAA